MKNTKRVAVVTMSLLMAFGCVGCNSNKNQIDQTKTQLVIGYKAAGYGSVWVENAKKMFEEKFANYSFEEGKTGVQVWITHGKDEFTGWTFYNALPGRTEDMYLGADIWYTSYNETEIYDFSELVKEPLTEFGEEKSIADKVLPYIKEMGFWSEEGIWLIPTQASSFGLTVYDVDLFEEKGYYFAEDGSWTKGTEGTKAKSKGFDGIAGTYDDGLPITKEDWNSLLTQIYKRSDIPITWTGLNDSYGTGWLNSMFVNYDEGKAQKIYNTGYGDYTLLHKNGDGSYSLDETPTTFDGQKNFYENARFPAYYEAIKTAYEFIKNENNYSKETFKTTQTHIEAQNEFLTSIQADKRVAMIFEGSWWETESDDTFTRMAKNDESLSKHNRRFGIMPAIKLDGNTATKHTYLINAGTGWIPQKTAKKGGGAFEASKMFCKMLASDDFLNMYTKTTNVPVAYEIDYAQDTLDSMTYFGKQLMEIIQDPNDTHVLVESNRNFNPAFKFHTSYPLMFASNVDDPTSSATASSAPLNYFRFDATGKTAEDFYNNMYTYSCAIYDKNFAATYGARN